MDGNYNEYIKDLTTKVTKENKKLYKVNWMEITKAYLKDLTYQINGAAVEVHKFLGLGLLESIYHKCLKRELDLR